MTSSETVLVLYFPDRRNYKFTLKHIKNNATVDKEFDWVIRDLKQFSNNISYVTEMLFCVL